MQWFVSFHSGKSIPIDKQIRIFDFLDKEEKATSYKSWGLGLTLVKMVAETHNGSIELQSSEETGTIFTATLQKNSNKVGKIKAKLNENVLKSLKSDS